MVKIIYGRIEYIESFHRTLDQVAREEIYLEMIQAKSLADTSDFQRYLMNRNLPVFYAIENDKVVGWVDINASENPMLCHRGFLGMGLLKEYRGQGLGKQLLNEAINHARNIGLEKVELSVYTTNYSAISLYKKIGFKEIGLIKHYRKHKEAYLDCIEMEMFL